MKIGFVADVHLGNHKRFGGMVHRGMNERCLDIMQLLQRVTTKVVEEEYDWLVINGDLFDTSWPEPQILSRTQDILGALQENSKRRIEVVLLVGNHDQQSNGEGDHALGVLKPFATIVENPQLMRLDGVVELLCVPYRVGVASEWLDRALVGIVPKATGKAKGTGFSKCAHRLLAVHLGIADENTAKFLRGASDAVHVERLSELMDKYDIKAAYAGNWHEAIVWDDPPPIVQQIGALVPTGWDNPGLDGYGGFATYSTQTGHSHEELPGPRFVQVRTLDEAQEIEKAAARAQHRLYLKIVVGPELVTAALGWVQEAKGRGTLHAAEVLPDTAQAVAAARTSAMVARSEDSMSASLAAFIGAMPLDEGVSRQRVLDLVVGKYLAKHGSAA